MAVYLSILVNLYLTVFLRHIRQLNPNVALRRSPEGVGLDLEVEEVSVGYGVNCDVSKQEKAREKARGGRTESSGK